GVDHGAGPALIDRRTHRRAEVVGAEPDYRDLEPAQSSSFHHPPRLQFDSSGLIQPAISAPGHRPGGPPPKRSPYRSPIGGALRGMSSAGAAPWHVECGGRTVAGRVSWELA